MKSTTFVAFLLLVSLTQTMQYGRVILPPAQAKQPYRFSYARNPSPDVRVSIKSSPYVEPSIKITPDGILTANPTKAGAWPIEIEERNTRTGVTANRQYIFKAEEAPEGDSGLWSLQTDNYYNRRATKPIVIKSDNSAKLMVKVNEPFSYQFKTENNEGDAVYAYLGLPEGLVGDRNTGRVSGRVSAPGIYNFGTEVADQSGRSAEGFVTMIVESVDAASGAVTLDRVNIPSQPIFTFDLDEIRQEQIAADRELFDALALVNAARDKLAARTASFNQVAAQLAAAENEADKASANAAKAKAHRERAVERLRLTNKALNEAQDQLNLALLDQASAADAVDKAEWAVEQAQDRFDNADRTLRSAESRLQDAEAALSVCRENILKAENNLRVAKREFDRAAQDLADARDDLEKQLRRKEVADNIVQKARDTLSLAQQAFDDAEAALRTANAELERAEAARQAALRELQNAKLVFEEAKIKLGKAEFDLEKALGSLFRARARKEAADRISALALAEGARSNSGKSPVFKSLGGFGFSGQETCSASKYPRFAGSARIVEVNDGYATLNTGHQIFYGGCTHGKENIKVNNNIELNGVIRPSQGRIDALEVKVAKY